MRGLGGLATPNQASRGLKDPLKGLVGQYMGGRAAGLGLSVSPASITNSSTPATVEIVRPVGAGAATYAWALFDGESTIVANSPTSATTTFGGGTEGETDTATFRCTVTQGGQTAYVDLPVAITTPLSPLIVSFTSGGSTEFSTGSTFAVVSFSAGASNGTPPYNYTWAYGQLSGPASSIIPSSPSTAGCDFTIVAGAAPSTTVHIVECFMGDAVGRGGQTGNATITIHWTG